MLIPLILAAIIMLTSLAAFNNASIMARFQFNPWSIVNRKQYIRLVSHGFLHANWMHLFVNLFVLWSFGGSVIMSFSVLFPGKAEILFLLLFFTALPLASIPSLFKNRHNPNYNAIGASGAVSAIVFVSIFFHPYHPLYLFAIIPIPGIIFGILYLWYSAYMARQQIDNIGHDTHFWGAVYGLIFPILFEPRLIIHFFNQLLSPLFNF